MRWEKVARVVVAAVGVGAAVTLYLSTRERPASTRLPVSATADPAATTQSGAGTDVRLRNGERDSEMEYGAFKQYPDGRLVYENLRMRVRGDTTLAAHHVECRGAATQGATPQDCTLTGQVEFQSEDGTTMRGESATYNDPSGLATIQGPASFSRGRMSGTGTGSNYERDSGIFRLLADAHVTIAPDQAGTGQADVTAKTMTFTRVGKTVIFDEQARIARQSETMTANRASLYLSDDEQQFKLIELRGASRVAPVAGKTSDLPDMQADDIDLAFYDGAPALQRAMLTRGARLVQISATGQRSIEAPHVSFSTAPDGKTLTRLEAGDHVVTRTPASADTPERTITAQTLIATGSEQAGLTAAVFDGDVQFVEIARASPGHPAGRRTGTSRTLRLVIKGQLDAIDEATFQRDARIQDGETVGDADLGIYRATQSILELRPASPVRRPPHLADANGTVDAADFIVVNLDSHDVQARGDVKTVTVGDKTAPAGHGNGALFTRDESMYGSGGEFSYQSSDSRARYVGTADALAQIKQGEDSVVMAHELVLFRESQNLKATGQVDSRFAIVPNVTPAGKTDAAPVKYRATADALDYQDATRTATYTGKPATLNGNDGETLAQSIVLVLQPTERKLDHLVATGGVHATLQGGRQAFGESLFYDAIKDQHTLKGRSLTLLTTEDGGTCSIATGSVVHFSGDVGAPEFRAAENPGGNDTKTKQPCVVPAPAPAPATPPTSHP